MTSKSKSLLKYLIAILLLVVILRNTDLGKILGYFRQISIADLLLTLVFVTLAQLIAAMRMRYFFHASGFPLSAKFSVVLYYVGAFYNFLLPGGIGGDAYKIFLARKRLEMPTAQGIRIMVADRASGLCTLMFILFASAHYINFSKLVAYANLLLILASVITLLTYLAASKILLKQNALTMIVSLPYSLISQSFWVLTLGLLWRTLGSGTRFIEYAALYAAASIASMLPVSVGGLGIKEMTYFYGAKWIETYTGIPVDGNLGVTLSLCIFALSFVAAMPGIFWLHKVTHLHHQ